MTITIEQIIDRQNELEAAQEELKVRQTELNFMIEEYKKQQEEAEFPKDGDVYYAMTWEGLKEFVFDSSAGFHVFNSERGLISETPEEARFKDERLKVIAELQRCGGALKTKTSETREYYLYGSILNTVVQIGSSDNEDIFPELWFPTKTQAQKAIDTIGEERLLKYWFCVEV